MKAGAAGRTSQKDSLVEGDELPDCSPERYNRIEPAGRHRCFNIAMCTSSLLQDSLPGLSVLGWAASPIFAYLESTACRVL